MKFMMDSDRERKREREMFDFITRAPLFFKWAYLLWGMWVYFIICSVHISLNDKIFIIKVFKNIYELVLIWLQKKQAKIKVREIILWFLSLDLPFISNKPISFYATNVYWKQNKYFMHKSITVLATTCDTLCVFHLISPWGPRS